MDTFNDKDKMASKKNYRNDSEVYEIEVPSDVASAVASVWRKGLRFMKEDGIFEEDIPNNFMVKGWSDGSLELQVVQMPKGIISILDEVDIPDRWIDSRDSVLGQTRKVVSNSTIVDKENNLRSLMIEESGVVKVEDN